MLSIVGSLFALMSLYLLWRCTKDENESEVKALFCIIVGYLLIIIECLILIIGN